MRGLIFLFLFIIASCRPGETILSSLSGKCYSCETFQLLYPKGNVFGITNSTKIYLPPSRTGQNFTFTASPSLPAGLTLQSDGVISGTPSASVEDHFVTITLTNENGSETHHLNFTFLNGFVVDTPLAGVDSDGGADANCVSVNDGLCSLQAAIQTANTMAGKNLIMLEDETYYVDAASVVLEDLIIAGENMHRTRVRPASDHPGHRFVDISTAGVTFKIQDAAFSHFGSPSSILGGFLSASDGNIMVSNSLIQNNQAGSGDGGAFHLSGPASLLIEGTSLLNNNAGRGGALWAGTGAFAGIHRSFFGKNSGGDGSAVFADSYSTVEILASTLFNNNATNGTLASNSATFDLINITMAFNTGVHGGLFANSGTTNFFNVANSIIAFNTNNNCYENTPNGATNTINSVGYNMFDDNAGNCSIYFNNNDLLLTDPLLSTMAPKHNGGPTPSFMLSTHSPAIDAGNDGACTKWDQRGMERPQGNGCDIGALEIQ